MAARLEEPPTSVDTDFLTFPVLSPDKGSPLQSPVPEDKLFTYVIVRGDLDMSPGKIASQAVHAGRLSLLRYLREHPARADEFIGLNSCGSVGVLVAKNLGKLEATKARADAAGVPSCLFADSEHIPVTWHDDGTGRLVSRENPNFDGSPTVTALSLGPATRETMRPFTKQFQCVR
jgi:peptidyl-tRNA hydrolase